MIMLSLATPNQAAKSANAVAAPIVKAVFPAFLTVVNPSFANSFY